jgi:hypothetical protein
MLQSELSTSAFVAVLSKSIPQELYLIAVENPFRYQQPMYLIYTSIKTSQDLIIPVDLGAAWQARLNIFIT